MTSLQLLFVSVVLAAPPAAAPPPAAPPPAAKSSEAEKIARLQKYVEEGEKELARVRKQLEGPDSEYERAQRDFREIDSRLKTWTRDVETMRKEGRKDDADSLDKDLESLRRKRVHARERFDLAITERKALQEKAASLPGKIEKEKQVLARALGDAGTPVEKKPETPTEKKPEATVEKKPETPTEKAAKESRKLKEAREVVKLKEDQAKKALEKVNSIRDYRDRLKKQIELEQTLLETSRKKVALARQSQADLEEEQRNRITKKASEADIAQGAEQIDDAKRRVDEAGADERDAADRLTELQEQLARVNEREIAALKDAENSAKEAGSAAKQVRSLENPFNPRNVLQWFAEHGGRLAAILAGMTGLYLLLRGGSRRIVHIVSSGKLYTGREGEDRAETLVGVFRTTASAAILGGGILMLLDEVGIPIVPLMGGAAVLGLAVAFGAQNLIKDYFTGFMILLEDQYAVNDIVKINNVGGKVEKITLRMTLLRDSSGIAHFIPHGSISTVSNMSHSWSRVNLEIGVSYSENIDEVIDVLKVIAAELRRDAKIGPMILEDAEVPGVDALADSAVVVKMLIKTLPTKQWDVKRELLRRIKKRFDQLGIEIPFPQRTIHTRTVLDAGEVRRVA